MKRHTFLFYASLVLLQGFLWGVGNPLIKLAMQDMPVFFCLTLRYLVSSVVFGLFFYKRIRNGIRREIVKPCIYIAVATACAGIFNTVPLLYTKSMTVGFIIGLPVVLTPFLSCLLCKTELNVKNLLPVLIVSVGLYMLCVGKNGFVFGFGELLSFIGATSLAFTYVLSGKYMDRYSIDPIVVCIFQTTLSFVVCAVYAVFFEQHVRLQSIPVFSWVVSLYIALGCTCGVFLLQNTALKNLPATHVSLLLCSEPLFTAIMAFFILGERLSFIGSLGAFLIMIGIIAANLLQSHKQKSAKESISS